MAQVSLATRADLFQLVSFFDRLLPAENDIHSFVVSSLVPGVTLQNVYFAGRADAGDFKAVVVMRGEKALDKTSPQQKLNSWIMCAWSVDDSALADIYCTINDIVNWERDEFVIFGKDESPHPYVTSKLTRPLHRHNLNRYILDIPLALNYEAKPMDDVYVKSLEPRDAQTVFNWWPYNPSTTVDDVADELARLPSAGVFLKSSNKLVSCMNLHPPNGMSRLFTLEEHRRKGYADLLTRYLSKRVAQAGHSPYVHITEGNTVSEQFFHHMGFRLQRPGYIHTTLH